MNRMIHLLVTPQVDTTGYIRIIDLTTPAIAFIDRNIVAPRADPIRQLIEDDVICHSIMTCDGRHVVNCRTKFNGNRKTYQIDDTTYEVEFRF